MSISYEEAREWAIDRATDWALDDDGGERLAIGGLRPAWALRIEAFNRLMPIATKAAGIRSDFGGGGVRQTLKDRGWDRAVRLLSLRAVAALRPGSRPTIDARTGGSSPVAFLHELATPSGSEPMLAVAAALPKGSYRPIVVDARTARAWQRLGEPAAAALLPWWEERSILRAARIAADQNWTRLAHDPRRFRIGDADVTIAAMQTLEPLARRSLPWLAVESLALARQLDRIRPSRLIIASDQHRWGRLGVAAAAERGIHTLVLQHGLPQYRLGFLPVVADAVATWSAESDAWLSAGGAPADRLIRFGNPRLDRFARLSRRSAVSTVVKRHRLAGAPRLLLALSPNDQERNLALLDLVLDWLRGRPDEGGAVIVKLHPGDGRWAPVRERVADSGTLAERIRIARGESLYPLLLWADAVVIHRSTVAVEALAAGTPVILGGVGRTAYGDEMNADLRLPEVRDPMALSSELSRLTGDPARQAFIQERMAAIEATTGPLDGRVAERIASYAMTPP